MWLERAQWYARYKTRIFYHDAQIFDHEMPVLFNIYSFFNIEYIPQYYVFARAWTENMKYARLQSPLWKSTAKIGRISGLKNI